MYLGLIFDRNPRDMSAYQFHGATALDYDSAVLGDIQKQSFSVRPRWWYIDATIKCVRCANTFYFTAVEQKTWYEDFGFYVDSFPTRCPTCRRDLREIKELRRAYDRDIAGSLRGEDAALKKRMIVAIDLLVDAKIATPQMLENRRILHRQVLKLERSPAASDER